MRIRKSFAGAFILLCLVSGYSGLAALPPIPYSEYHSDKVLHFIAFFSITGSFYFILETTRKRVLHLTLIVCPLALGVGSEILQALLPNGREFDYLDIAANVFGSLCALGLCAAYHRRMLERKRAARGYRSAVGEGELDQENDVELGTGPQESRVTGEAAVNIDEELDHWDENEADEWDEDESVVKPSAVTSNTNGIKPKG